MELILTLIGEFVIAPILSFCMQVIQFVFWMCCWLIWGLVRSCAAVWRCLSARYCVRTEY